MANTRVNIDVNINTSDAARNLRQLQAQINSFQSALNTNNRLQGDASRYYSQQIKDLANQSGMFSAETIKMRTAASQLDQTLSKGQGTMSQFISARFLKDSAAAAQVLSLANSRASALQTQFVATGAAANGFREAVAIRPLQAFNSETAISAQKLAIHRAMLSQSTTSMINFGKNTQWAGRQLMVGFTVPLTIFAATAGKVFREIEKESINFKKVYGDSFTTPEELNANLLAVQGLAKEYTKYGIAVKDTIGLAAQAAAAGSQGADLIDATTEATRLATLGQMDQNQALETTIALQTAFNLSGKDLSKTINFLNMVENQTVVTLQDLAQAIPRVAPVIKGLGGSVEDMAVMLAAMREGGITAAQGANALKSGLASLINPTDRAVESLEKMGVNLNYIVQTNRGDLMGTVKTFAQALSTLDEFQQQQALEKVFGKFQYARLGALFDNIIKDGSQASRVMDAATLSASQLASSAEKELGAIEDSAATKFVAAMEKLKLAIAPIGEMFTEMAIPVLGFLGSLVEKFNSLPDFAKKFIGFGTVITGIIIPAGTMFLGLLMNLAGTLTKFGLVVGVAFKGFAQGGLRGSIEAVSQALNYMSLTELDAANASSQLGTSTGIVNQALRDQVPAAAGADAAIDSLSRSYAALIVQMTEAATLSRVAFVAPGAAMAGAAATGAEAGRRRGGPRVRRNSGGTIPGSGNTDTVPAMLTPGEFVVNKQATGENLALLYAINKGREVPGFNKGGQIPGMQYFGGRFPGGNVQQMDGAWKADQATFAGMFGIGGNRRTQASNTASSRGSENIYNSLTGNYERGQNVRVDTLRYAVEKLGFNPQQLGLKTRGNLTFRMSKDSNLAMMRGDLTRENLLKELETPDVYSPLARQLDSYLGARLDTNAFDRMYREEIGKLPLTGINNGRFEKASRNAVRRYLDSAGFPKARRNSFIRDVLQGDTVNANMSLPAIKQALDARGIQYTSGQSKKDLYVDMDGRQVNIGNLAGRESGNLGRPQGILDYAGLRGSGEAVHANKGGMIPGIQEFLLGGGVKAIGKVFYGGFHTSGRRAGLPRTEAPSEIHRLVAAPYATAHQSAIDEIITRILTAKEISLSSSIGKQMREANVAHRQVAKVDKKRGKIWKEKETFGAFGAENKGLEYLLGLKRRNSREIFLKANENLKGKEKEIFDRILLGKHPETKEELVVFQKMLQNVDEFVEKNPNGSWKDGQGKSISVARFKKSSAYEIWKPVLQEVIKERLEGRLGGYPKNKGGIIPMLNGGGIAAAANATRGARGRIPANVVEWFSRMTTSISQSNRDDMLQNIPANIRRGLSTARRRIDITRGSVDPIDGATLKEVSSWSTGQGVGRFMESSRLFDTMNNSKFQISGASQRMKRDLDSLKSLGPDGPRNSWSQFHQANGGLSLRLTPEEIQASGGVIWKANKKKLEERIRKTQEFIAGHQKIIDDLRESNIPTIYRTSVKKGERYFDVSDRIVPREDQRIDNPAASNAILEEKEVALLGARLTGRPKTRIVEREEAQARYDKAKEEIKRIRMAIFNKETSAEKAKPDLDRLHDETENMAAFVNWGRGREVTYPSIVSRNMGGMIPDIQYLMAGARVKTKAQAKTKAPTEASLDPAQDWSTTGNNPAYDLSPAVIDFISKRVKTSKSDSAEIKFLQKRGIDTRGMEASGKADRWNPKEKSAKDILDTQHELNLEEGIPLITEALKRGATDEEMVASILAAQQWHSWSQSSPEDIKKIVKTFSTSQVHDLASVLMRLPEGHQLRSTISGIFPEVKLMQQGIGGYEDPDLQKAFFALSSMNKGGMIPGIQQLMAGARVQPYVRPKKPAGPRVTELEKEVMRRRSELSIAKDQGLNDLIFRRDQDGKLDLAPEELLVLLRSNPNISDKQLKEIAKYHSSRIKKGMFGHFDRERGYKTVDRSAGTWRSISQVLDERGYPVVQKRNIGGQIFDSTKTSRTIVPGVGNKDTVPAALTPGEFVINKDATRKNLDLLRAVNNGTIRGYADGDIVTVKSSSFPDRKEITRYMIEGFPDETYATKREAEKASKIIKAGKRTSSSKPNRMMGGRGMGASMGMGTLGGAMMMAPMIPAIGENASLSGAFSGAGMGMSLLSVLPMLVKGGPLTLGIGAAGVGLLGLGMAIKNNIESQDEASKKALELGSNLGGTANSLKKVSDVLGVQTPAEKQAQLKLGLGDDSLQKAAAEFSDIFQTEGFQLMIEELKEATSAERMTKLTDYLRNAVAAGMMKEEDARKLAKVIGLMLKDPAVGSGVAAAIKGQATGPQALLSIASGRSTALEGTGEMKSMRAGEEFTKFGGQEASKIIGGAFQIIQDAANAEAFARQQFAEGVISYETYSNVIKEAESLQIKYNDAINSALLATTDFGSTMNSVKQMLIDGGFITEEALNSVLEAAKFLAEQGATRKERMTTNPESIQVYDPANKETKTIFSNDLEDDQDASLVGISAQQYGNITVAEYAKLMEGNIGEAESTSEALKNIQGDLATAVVENQAGAVNYADIVKRMAGDKEKGIDPNLALQELYTSFSGKEGVTASEAFDATILAEQINAGQIPGLGKSPQARQVSVDVMTTFVSQGGDPAAFQSFMMSIPEEKRLDVRTAFEDMDQAEREAWINDFNKIQTMLGPNSGELTTEITLSAKYQDAGAGERENILNGIREFDKLPSFVEKEAIYALETNDGKDPLTREEAEKRIKYYNKIFKDMGSKDKSVRQAAEIQLAGEYNGDPVTQKQMNAMTKDIKNWDSLDIQSREEIISIIADVQANFKINGEFYGLEGVEASAPLEEIKKQIEAQIQIMKGLIIATESFDGDTSVYQADLAKFEQALNSVNQGIQNIGNISSAGTGSKGGSGGGGTKSIMEQLKEEFNNLKKVHNSMQQFINSKKGQFKGIMAGPFGPEFIEYLKSQGEQGLKILNGGINKIKAAYEAFKKVRVQNMSNFAKEFPATVLRETQNIAIKNKFTKRLNKAGFDPETSDQFIEGMGGVDAIRAYNQIKKKDEGNRTEDEQKAFEDMNKAIAQGGKAVKEYLSATTFDGASKSLKDMNHELDNTNKLLQMGYTKEEADQIASLGDVSNLSAGQIKKLGDSVKAYNLAVLASDPEALAQAKRDNAAEIRDIQRQIEEINLIRPLEDQVKVQQKIIDGQEKLVRVKQQEIDVIGRTIELKQRELEPLDDQIEKLQELSDKTSEAYDAQIEALDEIYNREENIAKLKQGQISVAQALSRGDVAAAAQGALEMSQELSRQSREEARSALESQKELATQNIQNKILEIEKQKKKINQDIEDLQMRQRVIQDEIYTIQSTLILPAENEIYRLQGEINIAADLLAEKYKNSADEMLNLIARLKEAIALKATLDSAPSGAYTPPSIAQQTQYAANAYSTLGPGTSYDIATSGGEFVLGGTGDLPQGMTDPGQLSGSGFGWVDGLGWTTGYNLGGKIKKYAMGGRVGYKGSTERAPGMMYGGSAKKYAYGSMVPGTGMTDKVPALLTPGEFVVRKRVAEQYGPLLELLNGQVFPTMKTNSFNSSSKTEKSGSMYNYNVNVTLNGSDMDANDVANAVIQKIKMTENKGIRSNNIRG